MRRPGHDSRGHLLSPKGGAAGFESKWGSMQRQAERKESARLSEPEPEAESWENPVSSWADDVRVMVTGFESMTEHDPAMPWTSWDTFFSVRYAGTPPSGGGLTEYFSRHMMSEFCKLNTELAALDDAVAALPFAPRTLSRGEYSEDEIKGRQEELDKWLRSVVWTVAPNAAEHHDSAAAGVLLEFLCGVGSGEEPMSDCIRRGTSFAVPCDLRRPVLAEEAADQSPEPKPQPQPQPQPEPEPEPEPETEARAVAEQHSSDEEEPVCRICRMEAEEDWPLFFPCKCSGSIKWVHQDCLQTWMKHSSIT
eukprot:COSAG02_NODE_12911_length_1473_cov_1.591703_1_plen_307_part_01